MTIFADYGPKPSGPSHPQPAGPDREPPPPAPQPDGAPKNATGPRPDTTRPVPTPRPAPGPGRVVAQQLDDIDATLVGLLAIAAFGPAEQGTAASADQACCAEVLLFRLRLARRAVRDLAEAYGIKPPARRMPTTAPSGGLGSNPSRRAWAPGSASANGRALGESDRDMVAVVAGAPNPPSGSEGGRAGGAAAPGAVQDFAAGVAEFGFSLPDWAGPPHFQQGEHRLVGRVSAR